MTAPGRLELPPARILRPRLVAATSSPVVVVGAGPYGLAAGAHLREAGVEVRVFGEPMDSWANHMPKGMFLRSRWQASHIGNPTREYGMERFEELHGLERLEPVPLARFVDYGRWFQANAVPELDPRNVANVASANGKGFSVELVDGERFYASRVVVAAGIVPFAHVPPEFEGIDADRVSHTAAHPDLGVFRGRRVGVVGGGQSAVGSAALLAEAGADVELILRGDGVRWLPEGDQVNVDAQPRRFYAYSRVALAGPEGAWLVAFPGAWRFIPRDRRYRLALRVIRPAAAGWLHERVDDVRITPHVEVRAAALRNGHVRVELTDGSSREFDHVLLATGYRIDIAKYAFLDRDLLARVHTWNGHPMLKSDYGSSVRGLHFLGAPAMATFGPVSRFVCGTWAAARGLTRGVVGRRAPRAGFSW